MLQKWEIIREIEKLLDNHHIENFGIRYNVGEFWYWDEDDYEVMIADFDLYTKKVRFNNEELENVLTKRIKREIKKFILNDLTTD